MVYIGAEINEKKRPLRLKVNYVSKTAFCDESMQCAKIGVPAAVLVSIQNATLCFSNSTEHESLDERRCNWLVDQNYGLDKYC